MVETETPRPIAGAAPVTGPAATPRRPARQSPAGRISKDGKQLSLVIGVAANDPTSVAVANTAADQLRSVGIAASVSALDPVVLYGDALANNRVDAIVGWHAPGETWPPLLASRYGCPALEATPVSTSGRPAIATDHRAGPAPTSIASADDSRRDHAGDLGAAGAPSEVRCAGTGAVQPHRYLRSQHSAQYRCRP